MASLVVDSDGKVIKCGSIFCKMVEAEKKCPRRAAWSLPTIQVHGN
jgi:ribosomal protein L24E